jgi:hypothetical protein
MKMSSDDPQRYAKPRAFEFAAMETHALGEWVHWKDYVGVVDPLRAEIRDLKRSRGVVDAEAEKLVQQRDALADALEGQLTGRYGLTLAELRNEEPTVRKLPDLWAALEALRKAGR